MGPRLTGTGACYSVSSHRSWQNTGGMTMKALRWLFLSVFVLSTALAVIMLLVLLPAQAQDGGRGGPPPPAVPLSQEVANEDPQTATMRNDRMDFPPFK